MNLELWEIGIWFCTGMCFTMCIFYFYFIKEAKRNIATLDSLRDTFDDVCDLHQDQMQELRDRILILETRLEEREPITSWQDVRMAVLENYQDHQEIDLIRKRPGRPPGSKNKEKTPGV